MVPQIAVRPADDLYVVTFLYYMFFKFSSSSAFYCTYYRFNFVFTLCSGEVITENFVHRGLPISLIFRPRIAGLHQGMMSIGSGN